MPFTQGQFFGVFRDYNLAVWPIQWILNLLAVVAIVFGARGMLPRLVNSILAGFWAWMAVAYHLAFFSRINRAAVWFGVAFLIEAGLLFWHGTAKGRIRFRACRDLRTQVGLVLMMYALVLYPALGYLFGQRYPSVPTFGLPCPTTIFTFGLLLWAVPSPPRSVLAIPALWSVLGLSAAISLGVPEDYGLIVAGLVAIGFIFGARRSHVVPGPRGAAQGSVANQAMNAAHRTTAE